MAEVLERYAKQYFIRIRFGQHCLFNVLSKDLLCLILPFLIIPFDDEYIQTLLKKRKIRVGRGYAKSPVSKTGLIPVRKNKHFDLHPVTAQHQALRMLAQTCREFRNIVRDFRIMVDKQYCILHSIWPGGTESFLAIEKRMTHQRSIHTKKVKKAKRTKKPWAERKKQRELTLMAYKLSLPPATFSYKDAQTIRKMEMACMHPFQYYLKYIATTHKARLKRKKKLADRPERKAEDQIQEVVDNEIDYLEDRMPKINGKRYE